MGLVLMDSFDVASWMSWIEQGIDNGNGVLPGDSHAEQMEAAFSD